MSATHPIIAITGSSGAGTTSVTRTFEHIFRRESMHAAIIEGDSFHRYDREAMKRAVAEAEQARATTLQPLRPRRQPVRRAREPVPQLRRDRQRHSRASTCTTRRKRRRTGRSPAPSRRGKTCPTVPTCCSTKACTARWSTDEIDIAQHADLLIGVVPIINLEWIQKLHRDQTHARLLDRSGDRHDPAPHARLRALHLPAVLAHARQLPARADGRHVQPVHRARHPERRRELAS